MLRETLAACAIPAPLLLTLPVEAKWLRCRGAGAALLLPPAPTELEACPVVLLGVTAALLTEDPAGVRDEDAGGRVSLAVLADEADPALGLAVVECSSSVKSVR